MSAHGPALVQVAWVAYDLKGTNFTIDWQRFGRPCNLMQPMAVFVLKLFVTDVYVRGCWYVIRLGLRQAVVHW